MVAVVAVNDVVDVDVVDVVDVDVVDVVDVDVVDGAGGIDVVSWNIYKISYYQILEIYKYLLCE